MRPMSTKDVTVPLGLTNDRSAQGIINTIQSAYGKTPLRQPDQPGRRWRLLQAKLPNGQYLIPSAQITNPRYGHSSSVTTPCCKARMLSRSVDQGIANVDYVVSDKDRLGVKYYVQDRSHHQSLRRGRARCSDFRNSFPPAAR